MLRDAARCVAGWTARAQTPVGRNPTTAIPPKNLATIEPAGATHAPTPAGSAANSHAGHKQGAATNRTSNSTTGLDARRPVAGRADPLYSAPAAGGGGAGGGGAGGG